MTVKDTTPVAEQTWKPRVGPAWFDISNYEGTHLLTAGQWATLLEHRRGAWVYLQTGQPFETDDDPITPECLAEFYQFMDRVWVDPLLAGSNVDPAPIGMQNGYPFASDPEMAKLASQFFGRFVKRVDVGELVSTLALLGPISEDLLTAWRSGRAADFYPDDRMKEPNIWSRELSPRSDRLLLSIDLHADYRDAAIQFESLFKELQARNHARQQARKKGLKRTPIQTQRPDIAAFVRHRLLAYLDLCLWTIATGHVASWEEILGVVFGPDSGERDVDAFRKFATKYAEEAFRGTLIQRLRGAAQVA